MLRKSGPSKVALKSHLLQLKCHFTWQLLEKDGDVNEVKEGLDYQLKYLDTKNKYMVYNLQAYIMHVKGDYTEAIHNLKNAEEKIQESNSDGTGKRYLVTFGNYAWVYYHMKQYEDAQKYIDKIDHIYEELKYLPLGTGNIAEIYGEQGWSLMKFCNKYYEKARECFAKALELDPEEPEWHSGHATAVYRIEAVHFVQCPASECKSLELLLRAVEVNSKDAVLKALLALKLQDLQREEEGRKYIDKALQQAPDLPYLLRYVAKFYRRGGMVDEALAVLQKALALMPTSGFLYHQIGLCYRQKMFDAKKNLPSQYANTEEIVEFINKAIFHFEKVLELKKTFVYVHTDLANMYWEAREYQKAEDMFKKVLKFPNLTNDEKQQVHLSYGRFQEYCMKSQAKAIEHYKECFQIPDTGKTREFSEKALKRLAERKIKVYPPDASGFGLLGFVYKNNDKIADAIECYELALKYDPDNEEYLSEICNLKLKI
ncbi:interferon-induced protein with tetratricopeptide repeats 5-like [Hyperolius riggenbachi]|uniref:interferon-induced protein with tetratricopeptide repeats 5-like n=1 Tax=Hyperolius riggenbachi TaxID=752182 RepID=UPI0035A2C80D